MQTKTNIEVYADLALADSYHLCAIRYTDYGNRPGTMTEHRECERTIIRYATRIMELRTAQLAAQDAQAVRS